MRVILCVLCVLVAASWAQADIIDWSCDDDDDGAIIMDDPNTDLTGSAGEYTLSMTGRQFSYPAHVDGFFDTDTDQDPTVWIIESIQNLTDFDWTDYHIDIGMNQNFQIIGVIAPADWTWDITNPAPGLPLPSHTNPGTGWVGSVDMYAGTPVDIGLTGNFGLIVSFVGDVAFCTEQVPTPEPATFGLLVIGGLAMLRRRR
ncbi:MAG TPA: PEP-CTERM sorting domain-containing protein [Phycisphaerae bacterium]|nr:PEP-CTERM sorting domain-containing protein [Phycisphaerae bacterium]